MLHGSIVDDRLLDNVEFVESSGKHTAVGDGGDALGAYQFHRSTWAHVSSLRERSKLPVHKYRPGALQRSVARNYATTYLRWLEQGLASHIGRWPTRAELYAAWNMGLDGFRKVRFQLNRCSSDTRRAAEFVASESQP